MYMYALASTGKPKALNSCENTEFDRCIVSVCFLALQNGYACMLSNACRKRTAMVWVSGRKCRWQTKHKKVTGTAKSGRGIICSHVQSMGGCSVTQGPVLSSCASYFKEVIQLMMV